MKRERLFKIIQIGSKDDFPSRAFDFFISFVIGLNILVTFLETYDELEPFYTLLRCIELLTLGIFCIEYIMRILTADFLYPGMSRARAALRFILSLEGIVDLLTILPMDFLSGFVVFRMLRVVRIFHLFRINSHDDSFSVIVGVLKEKKNQILSSVFIIFVLMIASSLGIYSCEHEAQPEVYKNAFSGMWWSVATLFTVGYGDIYPITVAGRIMAIFVSFLGVGAVAIPTGIISAGFVEHYSKSENAHVRFRDERHIGEVMIDKDSPMLGLSIGEVRNRYSMTIYLLMRNDTALMPTDDIKLRKRDILVARSDKIGGK